MSKKSNTSVICPSCGGKFDITCWDTYNVSLFSSPKSKVTSGDIFKFKCPHCRKVQTIVYNCLYHDMRKNLMIYLMPSYKDSQYVFSQQEAKLLSILPNYKLRLETTYDSFLERIRILDLGLNDKLFEVIRMVSLRQVINSLPDADELYFLGADSREFSFEVLSAGHHKTYVQVPRSAYNSIAGQFSNLKELTDKFAFEKIDTSWLLSSGLLEVLFNNTVDQNRFRKDILDTAQDEFYSKAFDGIDDSGNFVFRFPTKDGTDAILISPDEIANAMTYADQFALKITELLNLSESQAVKHIISFCTWVLVCWNHDKVLWHNVNSEQRLLSALENYCCDNDDPKLAIAADNAGMTPLQYKELCRLEAENIMSVAKYRMSIASTEVQVTKKTKQQENESVPEPVSTLDTVFPQEDQISFCRFCGKKIPADCVFCPCCGKKIQFSMQGGELQR